MVSGIDTSGFAAGDTLYADATTPGALTNIRPTNSHVVRVGYAVDTNVNGSVLVVNTGQDIDLQDIKLQQFSETVVTNTNASGNVSLDLSLGSVFDLTLTGNITDFNITNSVAGSSFTLMMRQDATGSREITGSTDFLWSGGNKTLSPAANAVDVISVVSDGTNYLASLTTDYTA